MRDGITLRVYVDWAADGTDTAPDGYDLSGTSKHDAYVGAITDHRAGGLQKYFTGSIDEVRIYNYALSDTDLISAAGLTELYYPLTSPANISDEESINSKKVNFKDFAVLAQSWKTTGSPGDIGPAPRPDGFVDVQDIILLGDYWLTEIPELGLIAHWKLAETEGGIAHDSIKGNDGFGSPDLLWRPEGGKVDGALELDGIDDFLFTTFSLDPADGPFSVFAWVKGGASGQVIISQVSDADWLSADPSGNLMTDLKAPGRGGPLISQTVITDGSWRRVGMIWDGSARILYVDDVEVARDKQPGLTGSEGSLYIGAGSNLEAGSYWSGLIDDICVYNVALSAKEIEELTR